MPPPASGPAATTTTGGKLTSGYLSSASDSVSNDIYKYWPQNRVKGKPGLKFDNLTLIEFISSFVSVVSDEILESNFVLATRFLEILDLYLSDMQYGVSFSSILSLHRQFLEAIETNRTTFHDKTYFLELRTILLVARFSSKGANTPLRPARGAKPFEKSQKQKCNADSCPSPCKNFNGTGCNFTQLEPLQNFSFIKTHTISSGAKVAHVCNNCYYSDRAIAHNHPYSKCIYLPKDK
jgi:hypothetical protein